MAMAADVKEIIVLEGLKYKWQGSYGDKGPRTKEFCSLGKNK